MPESTEELDSSEEIDLENNETADDYEEEAEGSQDDQDEDKSDDAKEKAKKNKSNWAKTAAEAKEAKKLRKELEETKAKLKEWEEANPDEAASKKETARIERMEEEIFLTRNPEAEEHVDAINAIMRKYPNMERKDAWKFLKADLPKESKSRNDFSARSAPSNTAKKKIEEYTMEEALKLKGADYEKWAKANNMMK